MGYWINHNITAIGNPQNIKEYISKLTQRHPEKLNDDGDIVWSEEVFSFHNILPPPEEMIMDGSWWEDAGNSWRTENWECYDPPAEDIYTTNTAPNQVTAVIRFDTKYHWPIDIMGELISQYPNLMFEIWSEGEEGEAIEFKGHAASISRNEYEAPNSHADYVSRDNEEGCRCNWDEEVEDWYSDCPGREIKEYVVKVITSHTVKASYESDAIKAIEAFENGFELPTSAEVISYAVHTGYQVIEGGESND